VTDDDPLAALRADLREWGRWRRNQALSQLPMTVSIESVVTSQIFPPSLRATLELVYVDDRNQKRKYPNHHTTRYYTEKRLAEEALAHFVSVLAQ
jgi:hypothetical protein